MQQIDTPEFKRWFGASKVTDSNGNPLRVYHGTVHNFSKFSKNKTFASNDWGIGHYFTNSPEEVSSNYAKIGPDRKNRIGIEVRRLSLNKGLSFDDALAQVRKKLGGDHEGAIIPCYLRMERPFYYGEGDLKWSSEEVMRFRDILEEVMRKYVRDPRSFTKDIDIDFEYDDFAWILVQELREDLMQGRLSDKKGNPIYSEVIRKSLEIFGFDGIIDSTVSRRFRGMADMDHGNKHYIVFDSRQIKSAIGNKGTYSRKHADIGESLAKKVLWLCR